MGTRLTIGCTTWRWFQSTNVPKRASILHISINYYPLCKKDNAKYICEINFYAKNEERKCIWHYLFYIKGSNLLRYAKCSRASVRSLIGTISMWYIRSLAEFPC